MIKILLDLIYPQVCGICGKLDKNAICKKCEIRLKKNAMFGVDNYSNTTSYFNEHLYIFAYDGEIRKTILNYKFNDRPYIYKTFINFLKNNLEMCVQIKKYDIIIPVPISKKRYKQRGYNQSGIFAKDLARELEIKYLENVLIKLKDNIAQSLLNQDEREKNVQNVYKAISVEKIVNKNILLVDDIFTTGSTLNECSKVLKEAGASNIGVFTIAKD
jgi:ComF family protein